MIVFGDLAAPSSNTNIVLSSPSLPPFPPSEAFLPSLLPPGAARRRPRLARRLGRRLVPEALPPVAPSGQRGKNSLLVVARKMSVLLQQLSNLNNE
jgi:hypothetical protein